MPTLSLSPGLFVLGPGRLICQTCWHSSHLRLGGTSLPLRAACSTQQSTFQARHVNPQPQDLSAPFVTLTKPDSGAPWPIRAPQARVMVRLVLGQDSILLSGM